VKKSRLVIILVAVAVLTALFVWQGGNASEESTPPAPPSASSTPAQQQESDILDLSAPPSVFTLTKPISFLEVQRALGPWVPVDPLRPTGQKVVLSRINGTLEEGSRVIARDEAWRETKAPTTSFTYDMRDGYARLAVNNWFAQEVNYEQAFIFEIEPSAVYIIAADGTLYCRETSAILSP
jgi:hypothetical protein